MGSGVSGEKTEVTTTELFFERSGVFEDENDEVMNLNGDRDLVLFASPDKDKGGISS